MKISKLPVKLAVQIFATQLAPILLYGAEVWGPYVFNDYTDWERNDIEKVHTQFVKRIIGCDVRTSNLMA